MPGSDKLGDVYLEGHVRGDKMVPEARRLGKEAGKELGKETGEATDEELSEQLNKGGKRWAKKMEANGKGMGAGLNKGLKKDLDKLSARLEKMFSTTGGIDEFVKKSNNAGFAVRGLAAEVDHLREKGILSEDEYVSFSKTLKNYAEANNLSMGYIRAATDAENERMGTNRTSMQVLKDNVDTTLQKAEAEKKSTTETEKSSEATKKLSKRLRENTKENDKHNNSFRRGHRRLQDWQAIALAITATAPQLGALGSAVGAALLVVGTAALSSAVGIGVFVAAMKDLKEPLSELPANVRPAAAAFQGFKKELGLMQDAIQGAAVGGLKVGFDNLRATVEGLTPVFAAFGALVGGIFAQITSKLAPGTAGFNTLNTIIAASGPIFENIVGAVSNLVGAIGNIIIIALPFVQTFAAGLETLLGGFLAWTQTVEGKSSITTFFVSMEQIFGGLIEVAGSLGKTLQDVITPKTAADFTAFLGQLADFLPTVGSLIELVERLGVFEILGTLFEALTPIIDALMPALDAIVGLIGDGLVLAIQTLAPILTMLAEALSPVIVLLADTLMPILGPLMELFGALLEPIIKIVAVLLDALMPLIGPLVDLLIILVTVGLDPLINTLNFLSDVFKITGGLVKLFAQILGAVIATIVALFKGDFQSIGKIWEDLWKGMQGTVKSIWNGIITFIENGINGVLNLINDMISKLKQGPFAGALGGIGKLGQVHIPRLATGGILNGPTVFLGGEAGREAVVPLNRPLSQVDPAVRPLSAFAQGLDSGTNVGKSLVIAPGAISIVTPTRDPVLLANMVMDNVVAHALN